MNSSPLLRARTILVLGALLAGGTWVVAESKSSAADKPAVTVKVDQTPLARGDERVSFSPIVKRVAPSVVKVVTRERAKQLEVNGASPFDDPQLREFFGPFFNQPGQQRGSGNNRRALQQPQQVGLGSGVIVSADGYILTNNHVVEGADNVKVTLADGRELTAKVIGTDEKTDVAVIKVDAKDLPAITFAPSDDVQVGDRVLAVGNPFGLGQTVTTGIVSATGRAVAIGVDYADFIQTDAAINPGNSGGALIDMQGRLVGINTAILSRSGGFQGVGFAIPADLAHSVMNSLVTDGKVVRGFLGVSIQDLTPTLAENFKLKNSEGAVVSDVSPDSPAATAGLASGDVVLKYDGKAIRDSQRLRFAVAATKPGDKVDVIVLRDGKEKTLAVKIGNQPGEKTLAGGDKDKSSTDEGVLNGVAVGDLNRASRGEYEIPGAVKGAVVTDIDPNSASANAGLAVGDVILEINHKQVHTADEAVKLTEKTDTGKTLLKLWSRGGTRFLVVDESDSLKPNS